MNAPLFHPKLITSTLFMPDDEGGVLTGVVVAACAYEGTFYFLVDVEGVDGFASWDAELVYRDRTVAAEASTDDEPEDEEEDEEEEEDEDY